MKRCEELSNNLGGFFRNAIGRACDQVQIDHVSVTHTEQGVTLEEHSGDPDVILQKTSQVFADWTKPRDPQVAQLLHDPFWQAIYRPRADLSPTVWEPLLQPMTPKELSALLHGWRQVSWPLSVELRPPAER